MVGRGGEARWIRRWINSTRRQPRGYDISPACCVAKFWRRQLFIVVLNIHTPAAPFNWIRKCLSTRWSNACNTEIIFVQLGRGGLFSCESSPTLRGPVPPPPVHERISQTERVRAHAWLDARRESRIRFEGSSNDLSIDRWSRNFGQSMHGNALDFDLAANRESDSKNHPTIYRSISKFWIIDARKCFGFRSRRESNERIRRIVQRFIYQSIDNLEILDNRCMEMLWISISPRIEWTDSKDRPTIYRSIDNLEILDNRCMEMFWISISPRIEDQIRRIVRRFIDRSIISKFWAIDEWKWILDFDR